MPTRLIPSLALLFLLVATGCQSGNAALLLDSGPPVDQVRRTGGHDSVFAVHVGERVQMAFRSRLGVCDYAMIHDESNDRWEDCGPPINGFFEWRQTFSNEKGSAGRRRIKVTGYTIQGRRDAMPVRGALLESAGKDDEADLPWAGITVWVDIYQSELRMRVRLPEGTPDWALSKLTIRRQDGTESRVTIRRAGQPGFEVSGPDAEGVWELTYQPAFDQVNASGHTAAVLSVADERGKTIDFEAEIPTP
jgi:hypothetical protein